jgi:hypothetical protein
MGAMHLAGRRRESRRARQHGSVGAGVRPIARLASMLCALTAFAAAPTDSRILFAAGSTVPKPVRAFAWHVIETRCNYQSFEREQREFFAYDVRATRVGAAVVYSISIRSDLTWKRSEPPAFIDMTVVDDGDIRLTALKSTFVLCRNTRATIELQTR